METIFTILIIALPIVFKLIGRKLEQAGQQTGSPVQNDQTPIEDWAEVLRRHIEVQQTLQEPQMFQEADVAMQEERHAPEVRPDVTKTKPSVIQPKPVILSEPVDVEKEKIDKKKLILYSEIMKPKYTEQ